MNLSLAVFVSVCLNCEKIVQSKAILENQYSYTGMYKIFHLCKSMNLKVETGNYSNPPE